MPSTRAQRRGMAAARPQLHPTSEPKAYAIGVAGPPPGRTLAWVIGGSVASTALLSTLAGGLVGPGVLVVMILFWALNPPRGVVVTSNSAVVMKRSMFNGKPTTVLEVAHLASAATPSTDRSGPWLAHQLGAERVWLTRKEAACMVEAAVAQGSQGVQPVAVEASNP